METTPTQSVQFSKTSLFFISMLRIAIGWHFLYEGLAKLFTPGWTSGDYLSMSSWIFAPFFHWIVAHPAVLSLVDFVNIWGLIFVGVGLMLGIFTRPAIITGMTLLFLYYVANPPFVRNDFGMPVEGHYLIVNKNLIELLALGVLLVLPSNLLIGLDGWLISIFHKKTRNNAKTLTPADVPVQVPATEPKSFLPRRELLKGVATLPFIAAFGAAYIQKRKWESFEEQNLADAFTGASVKSLQISSLKELKGTLPMGKIKDVEFSKLILGGNLLSGYSHSRDLIYVSQLVKAYHQRDKIFATMLLAEKCGVNTLLTNPVMAPMIDEYWKRNIGKIQFISDCAGLNYDDKGRYAKPVDEYYDIIKRAIDYGACACYIQGETADDYMAQGRIDVLANAMQIIRDAKLPVGIGAHIIATIKACVAAGFEPDFWMKTMHHHNYWSAKHTEWHDNMYDFEPSETIAFMKTLPQPWIAFKVMAAGAIHPKDAFRYAFENGADFICAGMYDFQMVEDVNIAVDILGSDIKRDRPWMA
ncbi:MAG: DoxX family protein [Cyclobacteriaceae bacterium]|nr:DoxX family protein [Cyclobacteriaceae bacterium]